MKEPQKYAFVLDCRQVQLSPTKAEKAWYKVRHGQAKLLNQNPLTIQLNYAVDNTDHSEFHVGLDVGETTGFAVVQKGQNRDKFVLKAEVHHRKDVSPLITLRAGYRRARRQEKRYRPARFHNRSNHRKSERIPPSIKNHQDELLRVITKLKKLVNLSQITIEDVAFDTRALTDGYKPYKWQYQQSNRLDENLRKATLLRDNYTCQRCRKQHTRLQAHHITPKRSGGEDTIKNLITLCEDCHALVTGKESAYSDQFYKMTHGKPIGLKYATHVMQGKTYLRNALESMGFSVSLTDGGTTANRRMEWNIQKSHANDAIVITNLNPITTNVYEYIIKPLRKKRQIKADPTKSIVQGDRVYYIRKNKPKIIGYVLAILKTGKSAGMYKVADYTGKRYGPLSINSLKKIGSEVSVSFV